MKILVTGNRGYIGAVLTEMLLDKGHDVIGYDINYYEGVESDHSKQGFNQIIKDIRDIEIDDLKGIEIIIHLAALSNDPLGEFDNKITENINFYSTIRLAKLAKEAGVQRFVYASTQSM